MRIAARQKQAEMHTGYSTITICVPSIKPGKKLCVIQGVSFSGD